MEIKFLIGITMGILCGIAIGWFAYHIGLQDELKNSYEHGYKDGYTFVKARHSDDSILNYLGNIRDVPSSLRGCFINYYLETNNGWEKQEYIYKNYSDGRMVLFNNEGIAIDCKKY